MSLPKAPLWMQKMAFERRLVEIAARSGLRLPTGWRFFERSPLMKADHAAFLMRKGKTGAACVMTGAFGRDGFLSTPFADDEAAADALLGELVALQKQWGARRIVAPLVYSSLHSSSTVAACRRSRISKILFCRSKGSMMLSPSSLYLV